MIKRYGKAIECFDYENTINDEIEYARMMQGYCYYHVGDYRRARKIFAEFTERYPNSSAPRFYTALSHYHEGDYAQAVEIFKEIISIADEGTIEIMLARLNKAMILDTLGDFPRADEAVAMAIMMPPDNMKQLVLHGRFPYLSYPRRYTECDREIARGAMEALGISMKSVLQDAQQVQESLKVSARECQGTIQEYKKQILTLEKQSQSYQKQYSALNDLISLFIQTTR